MADQSAEWQGGELLMAGGTDFFAVRTVSPFLCMLFDCPAPLKLQALQVGRHATLRTKKKNDKELEV